MELGEVLAKVGLFLQAGLDEGDEIEHKLRTKHVVVVGELGIDAVLVVYVEMGVATRVGQGVVAKLPLKKPLGTQGLLLWHGAGRGNRTHDLLITNQSLYHLSYSGPNKLL